MRKEILDLGFAQFHNLCKSVCAMPPFSDSRKNALRECLLKLSEAFLNIDTNSLDINGIYSHDVNMKRIREWMLALDGRNGYTLSREMRFVIDNLCAQWVDDPEKFIFAATDGSFSLTRYSKKISSWDMVADNYYNDYHVEIPYQIVTIRTPKQLCSDFFFAGSLYHEMGHFVDAYYNITDEVLQRIKKRLSTESEKDRIYNEFFPHIKTAINKDGTEDESIRDKILEAHIGEYIADIFGTQYLSMHIGNHIEYNSLGYYDVDSDSHPSPIRRANMKVAFLNDDTSNFVMTDIKDVFKDSGHPLSLKIHRITNNRELIKGSPIDICNDAELHSIFYLGWEIYFAGRSNMEFVNSMPPNSMTQHDFYCRLNNAVRESIKLYSEKNKIRYY